MKNKNILRVLTILVLLIGTTLMATGPRITANLISPDKKEIFALDLPPFISTDIKKSGMLNEIVIASFKEVNEDVIITTLPLQSMVKYYLTEDNAVGVMGRHLGLSQKDKESLELIPLFITQESYLYYKPLHPNGIKYEGNLSELKGFTYGASRGEDITIYKEADIEVKKVRTLSLFKKLKSGKVDFISMPKQSVKSFIEKRFSKDKNDFISMQKSSGNKAIYIYFNTKNSKGEESARSFKKGLEVLLKNGKYGDILRKHIKNSTIVDRQIDYMNRLLK